MEDAEDDSQINDDDWEDMEIEDDMENMVDIYSFFAYKKVQNHSIAQANSIRSRSSTFSKIIWVKMHCLMHHLLSLAIMNSNTSTECREHHSISLFH